MDSEEIEKRFADHHRRFTDKLRDCKQEVHTELGSMAGVITAMQKDIKAVKEILEAWNSMKGFASGMKLFSTIFKVLISIAVVLTGLYYFIKTGTWPK